MRLTGRFLNKKYRLGAVDARYREDGVWYHPLRRFPGVLFDRAGYVEFSTEQDYMQSSYVQRGPDPDHIHVLEGIAKMPAYVPLSPPPYELAE
jgi:5-methylcytosine-specific restriction protein A